MFKTTIAAKDLGVAGEKAIQETRGDEATRLVCADRSLKVVLSLERYLDLLQHWESGKDGELTACKPLANQKAEVRAEFELVMAIHEKAYGGAG